MPIYEFRCVNLHTMEQIRSLGDNDPLPCPYCGEDAVRVPSSFRMPCAKRVMLDGFEHVINDKDDPWRGTPLEGAGEPRKDGYESKNLFFDLRKEKPKAGVKKMDYATALTAIR